MKGSRELLLNFVTPPYLGNSWSRNF